MLQNLRQNLETNYGWIAGTPLTLDLTTILFTLSINVAILLGCLVYLEILTTKRKKPLAKTSFLTSSKNSEETQVDIAWVPQPTISYKIQRAGLRATDNLYRKFLLKQLPNEGYKFVYEPWVRRRNFLIYKNLTRDDQNRWAMYNTMSRNFVIYVNPKVGDNPK